MSLVGFLLPSQLFVKILEVLLGNHLPNRSQKLTQLVNVKYAVVVPVEKRKILLVFLLLLDGNIFLNLFLSIVIVLVDRPQQVDLSVSWYFGEVVHQGHLLSNRLSHQLQ